MNLLLLIALITIFGALILPLNNVNFVPYTSFLVLLSSIYVIFSITEIIKVGNIVIFENKEE